MKIGVHLRRLLFILFSMAFVVGCSKSRQDDSVLHLQLADKKNGETSPPNRKDHAVKLQAETVQAANPKPDVKAARVPELEPAPLPMTKPVQVLAQPNPIKPKLKPVIAKVPSLDLSQQESISVLNNLACNIYDKSVFKLLVSIYAEIPGVDSKQIKVEVSGDSTKLSSRILHAGQVLSEVSDLKVPTNGQLSDADATHGFRFGAVCGGENCSVLYAIFRKVDDGKLIANFPVLFKKINGTYQEATLHPQ